MLSHIVVCLSVRLSVAVQSNNNDRDFTRGGEVLPYRKSSVDHRNEDGQRGGNE